MDSLNTHKLSTLYEAFAPVEASRQARGFEVHHTPRHGSWLNMEEIEINVLARQCPGRRIRNLDMLRREVAAWERRRNRSTGGSGPMMPVSN